MKWFARSRAEVSTVASQADATVRIPFLERRVGIWTVRFVTLAGLLAIWEVVGRSTNRALFAPPSRVVSAFYDMAIESAVLWRATLDSLGTMFIGLIIAIPVGVLLGALMGRYRSIEYVLDPYVSFVYALPIVVLVPLIIIWMGIGDAARVFIVFLISVMPVIINTLAGAKHVSSSLLDVAISNSANRRQELTTIVVPSILPYVFTGIQLAIGNALIGMIIAELLVVVRGLGGLILTNAAAYKPARMIVPLLSIIALSIALTKTSALIRRKAMPWEAGSSRLAGQEAETG